MAGPAVLSPKLTAHTALAVAGSASAAGSPVATCRPGSAASNWLANWASENAAPPLSLPGSGANASAELSTVPAAAKSGSTRAGLRDSVRVTVIGKIAAVQPGVMVMDWPGDGGGTGTMAAVGAIRFGTSCSAVIRSATVVATFSSANRLTSEFRVSLA